jgi:hypothetical protein
MLKRMKAERNEARGAVCSPDSEYAALFVQRIAVEWIGRQHVPVPRWQDRHIGRGCPSCHRNIHANSNLTFTET